MDKIRFHRPFPDINILTITMLLSQFPWREVLQIGQEQVGMRGSKEGIIRKQNRKFTLYDKGNEGGGEVSQSGEDARKAAGQNTMCYR